MTDDYSTDEYDSEDDDDFISGDELEVINPEIGAWYNFAVVSLKKSSYLREGEDESERQTVINAQLMIVDDEEFNGRRFFQAWWLGPATSPNIINREDFAKFFKAVTGETLGKNSNARLRDARGTEEEPTLVRAQIASAAYKDKKTGEMVREGQVQVKLGSWKPYSTE